MDDIQLNNGVTMPKLGLGVYLMDDAQVREAVPAALACGYRLIDTASLYHNEKAVGAALAEAGVPREELFVTSKVWFKDYGDTKTKEAVRISLDNLGLDYLDLCLLHQPFGDYYAAWRVLEELLGEGKVRAIGVSNFYPDRYFDLVAHNQVVPAVDQCETHPLRQQSDVQELTRRHGTVLQAWAPLTQGNQEVLTNETLAGIAQTHDKTIPQVMLHWLIQRDIAVVVKSTHIERLRENIDVFDFRLTEDEMRAITGLDRQQPLAFSHQDPRFLELLLSFE